MIIDAHVHLKEDMVFNEENREGELIRYYDEFQIGGGIIQSLVPRPYLPKHVKIHDRVASFCKSMAPREHFFGVTSISPHFFPEGYNKEAFRCMKGLGFVAIKITPITYACHPPSKDTYHVYEVRHELKIPLMIYTDNGIPFVDPTSVYQDAKDHPDVAVILAHAGFESFHRQARLLTKELNNVFLEPSQCGTNTVKHMIQEISCSKILFSSDDLDQIPVEPTKYRQIIRNEDDLENVIWRNANRIFRLGL